MYQTLRALSPVFALCLSLLACMPDGGMCDEMAVSSVNVSAVDGGTGEPLTGLTLTYSVDDGPEQPCDPEMDGSVVCGWEASGLFQISASLDGYTDRVVEQRVEAGECHPVSETLELVMTPTPMGPPPECYAMVSPSLVVTVNVLLQTGVQPVQVPHGVYQIDGGTEQDCNVLNDNVLACGWEHTGHFSYTIGADSGLTTATGEADVVFDTDGCLVSTEVEVTLDCPAC